MLTEQQLDQFIDEFWEDTPNEAQEEEPAEDLEEYTLPSDGMIIRQMEKKGKVNRRTWFALALMLLVVPLLLYLSVRFFHGRKYLICSLIVIVAAMLPFFMMFEGRKPKAREIMVISVLAAIGVAGRAAFFMVPSFKPVAAIVILTGVSFGGEAGFLVGCLIMMLSNMFMGQGPWTPWQMFSFGIIGFLAGILYQKGILKARKRDLCIYGFLSVVLIYGGIMNPKSAAIWRNFLTSVICAGIFTVIYGTCLFRMGATETQITRLALGFLIGITIVSFIILRTLAFINRKRNQNSPNVQERKETSQSKTEWTKIYNAQNIVETEQLVEMLKQSEIEAFSQEAGANVAMHGAPGFGIYGVDIFVKTDDTEKAVQLIKEINNQENEEIF